MREVRLVEGEDEEELVLIVFGEELDGLVRAAVGVGEVLGHALGVGLGLPCAGAVLGGELLKIAAHVIPVVGVPAIGAAAHAEVVAAVELPFADMRAGEAVVGHALADGLDVLAQGQGGAPGAVGVRIETGMYGGTGGTCDRLAGVGLVEPDALSGKAVDIRSPHTVVSIAAKHVGPLGVRHDQHNFLGPLHPLYLLRN